MGAYLDKPVTTIEDSHGEGDFYEYAAASMQGWRFKQEDAHSCLPYYDKEKKLSLFAVFDGHGGPEVAQYASEMLPEYIQQNDSYKEDDFKMALQSSFVNFDTLLKTNATAKLRMWDISGRLNSQSPVTEPEDFNDLLEEASMPIDEVLARYRVQHDDIEPGTSTERYISRIPIQQVLEKYNLHTPGAGTSTEDIMFGGSGFYANYSSDEKAEEDSNHTEDLCKTSDEEEEKNGRPDAKEVPIANGEVKADPYVAEAAGASGNGKKNTEDDNMEEVQMEKNTKEGKVANMKKEKENTKKEEEKKNLKEAEGWRVERIHINEVEEKHLTEVEGKNMKEEEGNPLTEVKEKNMKEVEGKPLKEVEEKNKKEVEEKTLKEAEGKNMKELEEKTLKEVDGKNMKELEEKTLKEVDGKNIKEVEEKTLKEVEGKSMKEVEGKSMKEVEGKCTKEMEGIKIKETEGENMKEVDGKNMKKVEEKSKKTVEGKNIKEVEVKEIKGKNMKDMEENHMKEEEKKHVKEEQENNMKGIKGKNMKEMEKNHIKEEEEKSMEEEEETTTEEEDEQTAKKEGETTSEEEESSIEEVDDEDDDDEDDDGNDEDDDDDDDDDDEDDDDDDDDEEEKEKKEEKEEKKVNNIKELLLKGKKVEKLFKVEDASGCSVEAGNEKSGKCSGKNKSSSSGKSPMKKRSSDRLQGKPRRCTILEDMESTSSSCITISDDEGKGEQDVSSNWESWSTSSGSESDIEDCELPAYLKDHDPAHDEEEPGVDSGTTAVLALLTTERVIVANVGDSRAILGRLTKSKDEKVPSIKAIELSFDHKPELPVEKYRVVNAGGYVDKDGRVDGGLNLSRALGDHLFKNREDLPPEMQKISPLPDVHIEELQLGQTDIGDQFLFIACDGIWNDMSSQEAVEFIWERMSKNVFITEICHQMFHKCLSPNNKGDGTGCDNMTAVLIRFSNNLAVTRSKRPAEDTEDSTAAKKTKV